MEAVVSLTALTLNLNYLKLRHQLVAAGLTLSVNSERVPDTVAQYAGAICIDCTNWLGYQEWAGPEGRRAFAVCLICYQAAALDEPGLASML
jgi:hypothetical protein